MVESHGIHSFGKSITQPIRFVDLPLAPIRHLLQLGSILSSPAVANGVVYISSADGSVYALAP